MPSIRSALPGRARLAAAFDALLLVAGLLLLLRTPRFVGSDGTVRLDAVRALADGRLPEMTYSLVMPIVALPLHWLGAIRSNSEQLLYVANGLLLALAAGVLWALLQPLGGATVRRFLLLLVFGSMAPAHVNSFYGEMLTAVCVVVGLVAVTVSPSRGVQLAGWGLLVLGVVNTPAAAPAFALVAVVHVLWSRRPWALVALAATAALILLDLRLRTGGFSSPYEGSAGYRTVLPYSGLPGFSYPLGFGLLVVLLSFGKGLVFFAPGLFLPVLRRLDLRLRPAYVLLGVFVAGLVLVYSRWWSWYGGYYWGPRFFLIAGFVAALVLAVRLSTPERSLLGALVTLGALVLSSWVAATAVLGNVGQDVCQANGYALELLCWFTPEFSVLWAPLLAWPPTSSTQKAFLLLIAVVHVRLAHPLWLEVARRLRAGRGELLSGRWVGAGP